MKSSLFFLENLEILILIFRWRINTIRLYIQKSLLISTCWFLCLSYFITIFKFINLTSRSIHRRSNWFIFGFLCFIYISYQLNLSSLFDFFVVYLSVSLINLAGVYDFSKWPNSHCADLSKLIVLTFSVWVIYDFHLYNWLSSNALSQFISI